MWENVLRNNIVTLGVSTKYCTFSNDIVMGSKGKTIPVVKKCDCSIIVQRTLHSNLYYLFIVYDIQQCSII